MRITLEAYFRREDADWLLPARLRAAIKLYPPA